MVRFGIAVFITTIVVMSFEGCRKSDAYRVEQAIKQKDQFIVKGFYLGMPKKEALDLIGGKYTDIFKKCQTKELKFFCGESFVKFDSLNSLVAFYFEGSQTNKLFKANDMSADDFAQEFIDSYGIKELNPKQKPITSWGEVLGYESYWEYRSPDGFELLIDQSKGLAVVKIPKIEERGFD